MIRILQVVTHMNRGGLETMLMNYYRQMDRTQVQFDFLTHRDYDGDYGAEIKEMGGILYHMPVLNPFSPGYRKQLGEFFDAHPEYKVIHVHQDCLSGVILQVAKKHGVPVRIAHSHGANQIRDIKYPIKLVFRHFIAKYATKLMACGEKAGNWMFCGAPFEILSNAIPAASYTFLNETRNTQREKWQIQPEELLVGHVGSLTVPKNHLFLLDLFNEIQKKTPAKLLIVGEGSLRPVIEESIQKLGIADKVILTGLRGDVADLLQAMDVFVFPSFYEGMPNTVIEAQATGLPCVIADTITREANITELVNYLPLTSPSEWAETALKAIGSERADTTAAFVRNKYDIDSVVREFSRLVFEA